jgi:hypothetical protein
MEMGKMGFGDQACSCYICEETSYIQTDMVAGCSDILCMVFLYKTKILTGPHDWK